MHHNRPYAQHDFSSQSTQYLLWILGLCLGVFILEHFLAVSFGSMRRIADFTSAWFHLSSANLQSGKLWTFFTYGLFHGHTFHLLFNMLIIFFIGRLLERSIGSMNTLFLFSISVLVGGCVWMGLHLNTSARLLGASAGATGMLILFCMLDPEERIHLLLFFVIPLTIKRKWIAYTAIAIDMLLFFITELPGITGHSAVPEAVAHSAHLGGMLGGYLFFCWLRKSNTSAQQKTATQETWADIESHPPSWTQKYKQKAVLAKKTSFKLNMTNRANIKAEVDRILDKINSDGFGALSEEEKKTLDKAGDQLK